MSFAHSLGLWQSHVFFSCVIALALTTAASADPKPLSKEEQAKVDKAIEKAVAYLKRMQTDEGDWLKLGEPKWAKNYIVGESLLAAYALLEAGVPADDPVIKKAATCIRAKLSKTDKTYELSLGVLFLDRLGDPRDKELLRTLLLRLIAGQYCTGGWSYSCPRIKEEDEKTFIKLLDELNRLAEAGKKPNAEWFKNLKVPPALESLTIFQVAEELPDNDPPARRAKKGEESNKVGEVSDYYGWTDNSNTQFAMLALWAAQRHQFPVRPTLNLLVLRFERSQAADGWWHYTYKGEPSFGARSSSGYRSMTCVGLLALAIGYGLKDVSLNMSSSDKEDIRIRNIRILKGLAELYRQIGVPSHRISKRVPLYDYYFLWSVERVAMLYNLPTLGNKEWYRWGVEILVTNQKPGGDFPGPGKRDEPSYFQTPSGTIYGATINTAFALLFLKRSHPMKDLTPKLLLKADELNKGILSPLPRIDKTDRSSVSPGQSRSWDR